MWQEIVQVRRAGSVWPWALLAGGLGIVTLVLGLRVANRLVALPPQQLPDVSQVPRFTMLTSLRGCSELGFFGGALVRGTSLAHLVT